MYKFNKYLVHFVRKINFPYKVTHTDCLRLQTAPVYDGVDAAQFNCENSEVSVGERNVRLKCEVRAQPRLTSLFWIIDDNGTKVCEGDVVDRYWTLTLVGYTSLLYTHETAQAWFCDCQNW